MEKIEDLTDSCCGYCGKQIEDVGKAYNLALVLINPDVHPHFRENRVWFSDLYCSKDCFIKATDKIKGNLKSYLQETDFAIKQLGLHESGEMQW